MSVISRLTPYALVLSIGIAAAQPLLNGLLPRGADALLHLYRVVALDEMLRGGVLYSRWLPNLAFGYGYPIFQYYPPLPHYVAALLMQTGLTPIAALLGTFVAASVLGALGMHLWARDVVGERWAPLAAAAYAFAPYALFNMGERMALAEYAALAWLTVALWSMRGCLVSARRRFVPILAVACAGIVLSHNITAMLAMPLLVAYAGVALLAKDAGKTGLLRAGAGLALGLGLAAFFWLPAFAERDLTRLDAALGSAYDFHNYFVDGQTLLSLPSAVDSSLLNSQVKPSLSWIAIALALVAIAGGMRRAWRTYAVACGAGALVAVIMTTAISAPVWDALPLLRFVLYPTRFLGLAAILLAPLAAAAADVVFGRWSEKHAWRPALVTATGIALFAAYGAFWQLPLFHAADLPQQASAIPGIERRYGIVGTTSIGEYAPVAVKQWPDRDAAAERLRQDALPAGARIQQARYEPLAYALEATLPESGTLTFDQFYFEGWQAEINGQAAALTASATEGLMQLRLPAGTQRVRIWFASTPLRDLANAMSAASAIIWIGLALWLARRPRRATVAESASSPGAATAVTAAAAVACAVLMIGVKTVWIDRTVNPWRSAAIAGRDVNTRAVINGTLALLDNSVARFDPATNSIQLDLYWRALAPSTEDFSFNLQVTDAVGETVFSLDREHPDGVYPTSQLPVGMTVRDRHTLALPPGTPPGVYTVRVAGYRHGDPNARLPVDGQNDAFIVAQTVQVGVPERSARGSPPPSEVMIDQSMTDGVVLNGATLPVKRIRVGEYFPLTLAWRAEAAPVSDHSVCFGAVPVRNGSVAKTTIELGCQPLIAAWPTSRWQVGDAWRVPYRVKLPPELGTGEYQWLIRVGQNSVTPGQIMIDAPPRIFADPGPAVRQTAVFSDAGELVGFTTAATADRGAPFEVKLVWLATRATSEKYTVFAQLVDANGERVAGHDGGPDGERQPTSAWLPGTYVIDSHWIDLPAGLTPGDYRIVIGMYETYTLRRLPLQSGPDSIELSARVRVK